MGNTLHVECSTCPSDSYLEIIDAWGQCKLSKRLQSDNTMVDVSHLNEGMYVLLILNDNGILYRGKLIKGTSY